MTSKRKAMPSQNPKLNYRPSTTERNEAKGTKPTLQVTSMKEIFTLMILYVCKKILFYNTTYRVMVYLGCLFLVSLIADVSTLPRSYLSRSDNVFNQYFVKFAWAWNLLLTVPYVLMTSYVYCCGEKDKIIKNHLLRIAIATGFWYFFTGFFNYIESSYGKCNVKNVEFNTKVACLKAGNFWSGFDISGHSFILIYGSLLLLEETRSIINWDSIKDYIRLEEHYRATRDTALSTNPLRSLTNEEFALVQTSYDKYTPYIRMLFISMTLLSMLWDFMLLCTMLYYHVMVEKFLGGSLAIAAWFITYRVWYVVSNTPKLPGDGNFRYITGRAFAQTSASVPSTSRRRTGSIVNGREPTFMGRPLYTNRNVSNDGNASDINEDLPANSR